MSAGEASAPPVKRGRSAAMLDVLATFTLTTPPDTLEQTRAKYFNQQLQLAAGSPLERLSVYENQLKWIRDHFPSDSSRLFKLLEICLCELEDKASISNENRFVKMWSEYADVSQTPSDIFAAMSSRKMCEKKALFWVCCASMAERGGNVRLADQMYLQGIRKLAAPEELLRKRYQEFQQRIARQDMHEVDSIEPSRKALGTLSESELQSGLRSFAKVPLSLPPSAGTIKPSIGRDDERGCEPSVSQIGRLGVIVSTEPSELSPIAMHRATHGPAMSYPKPPSEAPSVLVPSQTTNAINETNDCSIDLKVPRMGDLAPVPATAATSSTVFSVCPDDQHIARKVTFSSPRINAAVPRRPRAALDSLHALQRTTETPTSVPVPSFDVSESAPLLPTVPVIPKTLHPDTQALIASLGEFLLCYQSEATASIDADSGALIARNSTVEHFIRSDEFRCGFAVEPVPMKLPSKLRRRIAEDKRSAIDTLLAGDTYVSRQIGFGSFGVVFRGSDCTHAQVALKVDPDKVFVLWEAEIHRLLQIEVASLADSELLRCYKENFLSPHRLLVFDDAAVLSMPLAPLGSLLNILKTRDQLSNSEMEVVLTHAATQMLECVSLLHACGVVHTDVKPDNWVLRPGAGVVHICMIDMGKARPIRALIGGTLRRVLYVGAYAGKGIFSVRTEDRWAGNVDWVGVACCLHVLMFAQELRVRPAAESNNARIAIQNGLKRCWDRELWGYFFDTLLNAQPDDSPVLPVLDKLREADRCGALTSVSRALVFAKLQRLLEAL